MKTTQCLYLVPLVGLLALTACQSTKQMTNRPEFLSTYDHLRVVDDLNSRYVSPVLLGQCDKFIVSPVKILFTEVEGKPITAEQQERAANFVRQAIVTALGDRYPIVTEAGPGVAEIRVALTGAYKTGGKVGLCIQGEILDHSNTQVAAAMRTDLADHFSASWENKTTAKAMVDEYAKRLRKIVDDAHAK